MKRAPYLLIIAALTVALAGCAMLVQVDQTDIETYAAFQPFGIADEWLTELP